MCVWASFLCPPRPWTLPAYERRAAAAAAAAISKVHPTGAPSRAAAGFSESVDSNRPAHLACFLLDCPQSECVRREGRFSRGQRSVRALNSVDKVELAAIQDAFFKGRFFQRNVTRAAERAGAAILNGLSTAPLIKSSNRVKSSLARTGSSYLFLSNTVKSRKVAHRQCRHGHWEVGRPNRVNSWKGVARPIDCMAVCRLDFIGELVMM